ncbi:GTPase-associated system all-helical protein GASH [Achromobacter xylosoxidans]|uniref:GTPase-associated system all-helical protein GASH n=1 Tax=Alcaligenes xylosoxydans xylosoxydans TaxID=85698 RepID=UPI0011B56354|nr:GTPase-associated system all-helical protein GASH [Achromobacter xylosoxidans]
MQNAFPSWYASMSFQQDGAFTAQREAAIDAYIKVATKSRFASLAKLAFRLKPQMSSPDVAALREALGAGATPPGDEELLMLSASALAVAMESKSDTTTALAATVVACVSCGGLRELKQPMDLVGLSSNALRRLSETSRRRPPLTREKFSTPVVDKADAALQQALSDGDMGEAAAALIAATNKAISALARRQRDFESAVQTYVDIQDEELDILWWLEGQHSFDLALDFSKIAPEHLPLAIARELADLTKVLPGPPALSSLLSRTGLLDSAPQSITDVVQSMPDAWLHQSIGTLASDAVSSTLTPILFAMQRRHEVEGADDWISAWCTTTGLTRESQLTPLQLATAAYREFSLIQLG